MARKANAASVKNPTMPLGGVEEIAALDTFIEALGIIRERRARDVSSEALGKFWDKVQEEGTTPDKSRKATNGRATAKVELKRKTASQPLKMPAIRALAAAGIAVSPPAEKNLVINSTYAKNQTIIKSLMECLDKHGKKFGIPVDFIEMADPKIVVTDETVWDVLAIEDFQTVMGLIEHVASVNITETEISGENPMTYASEVISRVIPEIVALDRAEAA